MTNRIRRSIARKMFDMAAIIMPVRKGLAEGHHVGDGTKYVYWEVKREKA